MNTEGPPANVEFPFLIAADLHIADGIYALHFHSPLVKLDKSITILFRHNKKFTRRQNEFSLHFERYHNIAFVTFGHYFVIRSSEAPARYDKGRVR